MQREGALIAGSEMVVIQQALVRYWNKTLLLALVKYSDEQLQVNLLGKFHLWFVIMRAAENYSINI